MYHSVNKYTWDPNLKKTLSLSRSRAAEISLKKLQHLELMEDIVDLAKKVAVSGRMWVPLI